MSLETELAKFWEWANMTPETYNEERGLGEWEIEYPGWDELYKAADEVIAQLNKEFNHDLAQQLVYALAIDNESGTVLQTIVDKLESKLRFVKKAINSDQLQARWQAAELLGNTEVEDREKLLINLINRDKDKYVIRRALMSLDKVNHTKAAEFAKGFVKDPDPFMKLLKDRGLYFKVDEVYDKCVAAEGTEAFKETNFVKELFDLFTHDELSTKVSEIVKAPEVKAEVQVIYQTIEDLHLACPNHKGDWYFTGNYPTPGGTRVVNRAFMNFVENKAVRAY